MSRERQQWEVCERNTFAGIHVWVIVRERVNPKKTVEVARCHVCQQAPATGHRQPVLDGLLEERALRLENERIRRNFRLATRGARIRR